MNKNKQGNKIALKSGNNPCHVFKSVILFKCNKNAGGDRKMDQEDGKLSRRRKV